MCELRKISYELTTLSSLIVSPRSNRALYAALNEFEPEQTEKSNYLERDKLSIIYPFYQYGEYQRYDPKQAEYYLPGSSVKGALFAAKGPEEKIMVDDIRIDNENVVLRNLYKVQGIPDQPKLDVFFPNVGVEMVRPGAKLTGNFYARDGSCSDILKETSRLADEKMKRMHQYLVEIKKLLGENAGELLGSLDQLMHELEQARTHNAGNIFLLGGYKGLLHSINPPSVNQAQAPTPQSAVFVDIQTNLPHGLVTVEW